MDRIRFTVRFIGSILSFMNLMGILLYGLKHQFSSWNLYNTFIAFSVLRIILILLNSSYQLCKNLVCRKTVDEDIPNGQSFQQNTIHGMLLYLFQPLVSWFGFYRLLSVRDFPVHIFFNYCLELFLQNIPIIFVEGTNNATLKAYFIHSDINKYSLGLIVIAMFENTANAALHIHEIIGINRMRNEALGTNVNPYKYDQLKEETRRSKYYKRSIIMGAAMFVIFVIVLAAGSKGIPDRSCSFGQAMERAVCVDCSD